MGCCLHVALDHRFYPFNVTNNVGKNKNSYKHINCDGLTRVRRNQQKLNDLAGRNWTAGRLQPQTLNHRPYLMFFDDLGWGASWTYSERA